ncbi:MAG: class I SAM-dependent methyltransferase family protein, partial [Thermoprotei archaeon]
MPEIFALRVGEWLRLRDALRGRLTEEELRYVPSSFDIIGSRSGAVAIVEIPPELEHRKRLIGEAIMSIHKNVRVVLRKVSARRGPYRVRDYEVIAGGGSTEVIHKEHGCLFKLDPTKVYFSPREATERMRVARQVRPGEFVMLMFAGVCPYGIVIAKHQPLVRRIVAIEINPVAYRYMVENVRLNKVEDKVIPVLGDVRYEAKRWYGMCDRVIMPLPKGAHLFLDEAFSCLRPEGGVINFYHWAHESDLYSEAVRLVEEKAREHGRRVEVIGKRVVSPYAP